MRRNLRYLLMMLLVGTSGVQIGAAACDYAGFLKTHWARTRRMITNIVAAMPEDKYDFRPVKEVRSFREMAVHLIQDGISHTAWIAGVSREESEKLGEKYANYKTRDEILRGLNEMFDQGEKYMSTITDENAHDYVIGMRQERQTRVEAALVAFEDQMGHYGNMVVYLRLNGIVPPSTAGAAAERERNVELNKQQGVPAAAPAEGQHQH
jgi:uncharacterized damage-inducible protein DinB